jgi:acetylglutamate kinase
VGLRSETELYVKLFRRLPKQSFALVAPQRTVLHENLGALAEQLGFLSKLGLHAPVLLNAFDSGAQEGDRELVVEYLREVGVLAESFEASAPTEQVSDALRSDRVPVLLLDEQDAASTVVRLARGLSSRKLVVLRREGGIGPNGLSRIELSPGHVVEGHASGIGVINLRSDYDALVRSPHLDAEDAELLDRIRRLLDHIAEGGGASAMLSVASPLSLLKELFTVRGAGTLVKRGAAINVFEGYQGVDLPRLRDLLESAFERRLVPQFAERTPLRVFVEEDYRGVALLEQGDPGAFLSKFAVQAVARGEGLGQDLLWAIVREHPAVYWRSRPDNPINPWYQTVCDGMQRGLRWHVYWRGIAAHHLERIIRDAEARPADFEAVS